MTDVLARNSSPVAGAGPDALDEMVAEYAAANPEFPSLLVAAERRRALLNDLADRRRALALSQTEVAARMQTSQSALARLENSASDARLTTVERFAAAVGMQVEYRLVAARGDADEPPQTAAPSD